MSVLAGQPDKPSPADREWQRLQLAAQGSEPDLEHLYQDHVDGLYAFVFYRVGKDPTLAEDVVQETFAQALDRLDQYDPDRGAFRAWLRVLSRNIIRDHLRQHRRGREFAARWEQIDKTLAQVFEALDQKPLSDEVLVREETRDLVNMTIANLPERYRSVLELRYGSGHGIEELANRLKLGREAAKSLLARARRAFKEAFLALSRSMTEVK